MSAQVLYDEKQYLGFNKFSIIRRTVFAIFCFILYYWSENPKPLQVGIFHLGPYPAERIVGSGHMFFLLGLIVLLLSIVLIFVLHLHTVVTGKEIYLTGFWTSRKVVIPFSDIVAVRKVRFRESVFSRPSYHHFSGGKIRYYSRGNEAVELSRKDGIIYRIGSQRADELYRLLRDCLVRK